MAEKIEQNRLVIHLHLLASNEHFYFGSISALFDSFSKEQLGVAKQTLYNGWKGEKPFLNDKVVIRKGRLIQKKNASNA